MIKSMKLGKRTKRSVLINCRVKSSKFVSKTIKYGISSIISRMSTGSKSNLLILLNGNRDKNKRRSMRKKERLGKLNMRQEKSNFKKKKR
jgi:hypothetical protein